MSCSILSVAIQSMNDINYRFLHNVDLIQIDINSVFFKSLPHFINVAHCRSPASGEFSMTSPVFVDSNNLSTFLSNDNTPVMSPIHNMRPSGQPRSGRTGQNSPCGTLDRDGVWRCVPQSRLAGGSAHQAPTVLKHQSRQRPSYQYGDSIADSLEDFLMQEAKARSPPPKMHQQSMIHTNPIYAVNQQSFRNGYGKCLDL